MATISVPHRVARRASGAFLAAIAICCWAAPGAVAAADGAAQVRVVGGDAAEVPATPWMAAVISHASGGGGDAQRQFCGGALISPSVVMTAAHCVQGRTAAGLQVVLGRSDLSSQDGMRHEVAAIVAHPLFSPRSYQNDVALLRLSQPSTQAPVQLVRAGDVTLYAPWQRAVVLGWGSTSEGGPASPQLRTAAISVLPNVVCARPAAYGVDFAKAQMLCAGTEAGGVGSCNGDSGGPLTVGGVAIGVVSWARGCVRPGLPTVYTRLGNASINGWVRAATASLAAGRTSAPPPRTVVRAIGLRSGASASRLRFAAPGQAWASFQCSKNRGRSFRLCPGSKGVRRQAMKRAGLRVRAVNLFGGVDPSPALLHLSRRG